MIWSSTPGTPDALEDDGRAHRRARDPGRQERRAARVAPDRRLAPALPRGASSAGSTTTSAPSAIASSRRRAEKSAATIGRAPRRRSAAITARPTGPQPITSGASSGSSRALATACRPTAIGSVSAACSVDEPVRHRQQQRLGEPHVLAVAARRCRSSSRRVRGPSARIRLGRRADARAGPERPRRPRPVLDDLGAELVAHHHVAGEIHDEDAARAREAVDELARRAGARAGRSRRSRRRGS